MSESEARRLKRVEPGHPVKRGEPPTPRRPARRLPPSPTRAELGNPFRGIVDDASEREPGWVNQSSR
jgi:hypothetical protein